MLLGAQAQPGFEDGLLAYHRGDHQVAMEIWRPLAEQGHASAQYSLGLMVQQGEGVAQDDAQALDWYRKAAEQGNAWHAAGVANGGTAIEDPPGVRENGMYLAYLRDPDGNKICALCPPS